MHTIIIFRLALFSYCLLFNEERLLVERTRNYVHSAKRIVSANNNSVGYFVPLVKLYVVKIESAIETLKKGKKALRYALGEFDTKKIKKEDLYRVYFQKLELIGGLNYQNSEAKTYMTKIFPPLALAKDTAETVSLVVDKVTDAVTDTAFEMGHAVGTVFDVVTDTVVDTVKTVGFVVDKVTDVVTDTVVDTVKSVGSVVDTFTDAAADSIVNTVDNVADVVVNGCKVN